MVLVFDVPCGPVNRIDNLQIQASMTALLNIRGLSWPKDYKKNQDEDILDWLQEIFGFQVMVEHIINIYTREAGVRNLERNLSTIARAAAVKVAEQDNATTVSKNIHQFSSPVEENRLAEGAKVETEVIPMGVDNKEISNVLQVI